MVSGCPSGHYPAFQPTDHPPIIGFLATIFIFIYFEITALQLTWRSNLATTATYYILSRFFYFPSGGLFLLNTIFGFGFQPISCEHLDVMTGDGYFLLNL